MGTAKIGREREKGDGKTGSGFANSQSGLESPTPARGNYRSGMAVVVVVTLSLELRSSSFVRRWISQHAGGLVEVRRTPHRGRMRALSARYWDDAETGQLGSPPPDPNAFFPTCSWLAKRRLW